LQLEFQAKDNILAKFQNGEEVEEKEESTMQRRPSSTSYAQTMTKIWKISNSLDSSHKDASFTKFDKNTRSIGSKLLTKMGFDGKGLGINGEGMTCPI
jgi:hypothetical protein